MVGGCVVGDNANLRLVGDNTEYSLVGGNTDHRQLVATPTTGRPQATYIKMAEKQLEASLYSEATAKQDKGQ